MKGVNPADAARTLKTLVDVWDSASERMLTTVTKHLARGLDAPEWATAKAREVLAVSAELNAIMGGVAAQELALPALEQAYALGEAAAATLGEAAIATNPGRVAQLAARLSATLRGSVVPVVRAHQDLFQRAVGETELLVQTGTIHRREAVATAVDRLISEGVDRFPVRRADGSVANWHLDSYVRMAGRTMAQQAAVQGQLDGMEARGRDLVVISDSPRECPTCRPWEGKLLSITGASVGQEHDGLRVIASVVEARSAGLWHPNCTHRGDPFVPGFTRKPEATSNPDGYEDTQKLRRLERDVRQLKRELNAVLAFGDTMTARELRRRIRAKGQQIQQHVDNTGLNRRREREKPVGG